MAKELPYFQFEPAEYLTKDISFCSLSAQGLFINICAYYWQRQCSLTKEQFLRRFNYETEFNELVKEGVIDLKNNDIVIKFLDFQFNKATEKSTTNSGNGSKGGRPKKANENQNESENKPNQKPNESESKGIREDKIIKENIIKDKKIEIPAFDVFLTYAKEQKPKVDENLVKLKYDSWIINDWKDGNGKKIVNWKSKLNNTLPFIAEKQSLQLPKRRLS